MANGSSLKVITTFSVQSTPSSDTRPANASGNELAIALKMMEDAAAAFGESVIKDPAARADYVRKTAAARNELIQLVKEGRITPHEAAKTANAIRNQIMVLTRSELTDFGLALSKELKASGRPLDYMESRKAMEVFGKAFERLSATEKEQVWVSIVESAGKSNKRVNMSVKLFGVSGRVFLVATLAFAVYNVSTAQDKTRAAAKEGSTFAGGVAGGALASLGVAAVSSNPVGWVVGVMLFVGAAVGSTGSAAAFEYFWPEGAH
jgi:hypothetical protein